MSSAAFGSRYSLAVLCWLMSRPGIVVLAISAAFVVASLIKTVVYIVLTPEPMVASVVNWLVKGFAPSVVTGRGGVGLTPVVLAVVVSSLGFKEFISVTGIEGLVARETPVPSSKFWREVAAAVDKLTGFGLTPTVVLLLDAEMLLVVMVVLGCVVVLRAGTGVVIASEILGESSDLPKVAEG